MTSRTPTRRRCAHLSALLAATGAALILTQASGPAASTAKPALTPPGQLFDDLPTVSPLYD